MPFADRVYHGTVESVAVLPDPGNWLSSDTKVYETIVTIDQEVEQTEAGHDRRRGNPHGLPEQRPVRAGAGDCPAAQMTPGATSRTSGRLRRQDVELGQTNDKFVQVCKGLNEGDQLVLNPSAILSEAPDEQRPIGPDVKSQDAERL